jgi:hypothetical protein
MKMADDEAVVETTLPHSSFGGPDCCGCLNGIIRGDQADIVCNECEAVIRLWTRMTPRTMTPLCSSCREIRW